MHTQSKAPPKVRVLFNAGGWMPLGHNAIPPAVTTKFGSSRFTEAQQAANPDQPMTRLVKDVLRVGSWKVGIDPDGKPIMWAVTPQVLARIEACYALGQHRGVAMNLTKSHGDLATGIVPTDDLISPLDRVVVDNGVLWIATYVTPKQAADLTNPAFKVSPFVMSNWIDGLGNVYPEMLLHVAVTDQPVLPGQGPFVALANSQKSKGANAMDLATLLPLINQLLSAAGGPQIPEDADETNIVGYLKMAISMVAGEEADEGETTDDGTGTLDTGDTSGMLPDTGAAMNHKIGKAPPWAANLINQVKSLSNTVSQLQEGTVNTRKAAYSAKVVELATAGKISPAQRTQLEKLGPSVGYALANLAVFELSTPANGGNATTGKAAKVLSNPNAPAVDGGDAKKMTADEHAESLKKRGLKPVELH